MSECLVTKLKGTVDDSSLLKLDEIAIKVASGSPTSGMYCLSVTNTEESEARIVGDAHFTDSTNSSDLGTSLTIDAGAQTTLHISSGDVKLCLNKKSTITRLSVYTNESNATLNQSNAECFTFDSGIKYCTSLETFTATYANIEFGLSDIPESVTQFRIGHCEFDGDLSELAGRNFTALELSTISGLTGSLSDVATMESLTSLNLLNCANITGELTDIGALHITGSLQLNATQVTGSVEDYVAARRSAGDTSGSITTLSFFSTAITFNGNTPTSTTSQTLTWTESQITYNGVTVYA